MINVIKFAGLFTEAEIRGSADLMLASASYDDFIDTVAEKIMTVPRMAEINQAMGAQLDSAKAAELFAAVLMMVLSRAVTLMGDAVEEATTQAETATLH